MSEKVFYEILGEDKLQNFKRVDGFRKAYMVLRRRIFHSKSDGMNSAKFDENQIVKKTRSERHKKTLETIVKIGAKEGTA